MTDEKITIENWQTYFDDLPDLERQIVRYNTLLMHHTMACLSGDKNRCILAQETKRYLDEINAVRNALKQLDK